jgi:hypothetical protein
MKANKAGRVAENILADVMRGVGLTFRRQVPMGIGIFQRPIKADFVVTNLVEFPDGLAIESKWQDSPGSVDEKFPYVVETIQKCYRLPGIVIVFGGFCRLGALDYLRARCDGERLIAVYRLEEFISWGLRAEKRDPTPRLFSVDEVSV